MAEEQKYPLVKVHSMKTGDDYSNLLNDPDGDFQKYNGEFISKNKNTINVLQKIASENPEYLPLYKIKELGFGAYNLWLKITVEDSKGKPAELDSAEFIAWQREAPHKPVDMWAKEIGLDIISQKRSVAAGEQHLNIEWEEGNRRAVTYKGLVSEPREGYYGEIALKDSKGNIIYNSDGLPDIFLSKEAMKKIESGVPYRGRVLVMDQIHDGGKFDEVKFYFGDTGKNDAGLIADFSKMQASAFTNKDDFHNRSEGKYTAMSYAQYQAWTYDVSEHPENASIAFADWVNKKWGDKERFDKIFGGKETLSKEEYAAIKSASALSNKIPEDKIYNGVEFKEMLEKAGLKGNVFAEAQKILGGVVKVADLNGNDVMDTKDLFKIPLEAVNKLQQMTEQNGR